MKFEATGKFLGTVAGTVLSFTVFVPVIGVFVGSVLGVGSFVGLGY